MTASQASSRTRNAGRWHRRVRTPVLMQLENSDCGAACLGILLGHFGRWISLQELRENCGAGRDGANAQDIVRVAKRYGLEAEGWRRNIDQLAAMPLPLILFWGFNHFVVLEGVRRGRYYLNDPATGHRSVDRDSFDRHFTGVALSLRPSSAFERGGDPPGVLRRLWPWLREYRPTLAFAALCGLLLALPMLALPLLLSAFVDHVLIGGQVDWGATLAGAVAASAVLIYLLSWLQMRSLRNLAVSISTGRSDRYVTRLLRLPVQFFADRFAGDLASRVQLINQVANVGAGQLAGLAIDLVMSLLFLALMLAYDPLLALLVLALAALCLATMRATTRLRKDMNHRLRRDQSLLQGLGAAGLYLIDTLRATARENDFFARWSGHQATELQARQAFVELGHATASFPGLFQMLGAAAVLGLGGWRVVTGDMTLGTLLAFYVLASNFLQPVGRFAQFSDLIETLEADLLRLDDVFEAPEDVEVKSQASAEPGGIVTFRERLRLVGRLEMRNVTFGFLRNRPPLIENFSLSIEPGQRVAVVGPTGAGKSTLALLAAGVYEPWSGEVLFDGRPRAAIPREVLSASVSIIGQHAILFAATVRDNLTMWSHQTPDELVIAAARDAAIHEEIIARPHGYSALVEEGGRNFSGGQRQRLELARGLVNNPSLMILDEATSALDTVTEMRVDDAIRRRHCSCLIVAHRLSTIRDADLIIVLSDGRVAEQGTHRDLMANEDGIYSRFVNDQ